jgi:site-specific recombinase XerD
MTTAALPGPASDTVLIPAASSAALVPVEDTRGNVAAVLPEVGVAGELVAHVLGELPALAVLEDRERLLAAAWLASLRSARTRRSYAADLLAWRAWLAARGLDVLAAGRVHLDLWVRAQQEQGAGDASVRRRLSGVGSFYRYLLVHGLVGGDPTAGVARPRVDPDYTATVGLSREQGRALIAAADRDLGQARLRSAAVIRLLLHNALRVDEVLGADIGDLGTDRGHQVLTVLGKGNRRAKVPLTPATVSALHAYLDHRATLATGTTRVEARPGAWRGMAGPLLATTTGGRMRPSQLWELVRRLAHAAGITEWDRLSAHSLRHTGITLALDAGVPLRDVQDYARHRDARTTRRYDHSRDSLDRSAAYAVAAYLS